MNLKRVFSLRVARILIFGFVALVTLLALVLAFENWRGKRVWLKFKKEWEAKGEKFEIAPFIPARVPDEQNFAMTPFLAPLLDYHYAGDPPQIQWRDSNGLARAKETTLSGPNWPGDIPKFGSRDEGARTDLGAWQAYFRTNANFPTPPKPGRPGEDVLHALAKYDAVLSELREAAARPHAVFPIHYEDNISAQVTHLGALKSLANVTRLRALAELEEGKPDEALKTIGLSVRLAESIKSEPLLISQLVRLAIHDMTVSTVWEGLASGRWSESHLAELQRRLGAIDLLNDYGWTLRGERAFANQLVDQLRAGRHWQAFWDNPSFARLVPSGWMYQNQLTINRMYQQYAFEMIDAEKRRVNPQSGIADKEPAELKRRHPYRILAALLFPALTKACHRFGRAQVGLDEAVIACALERYRLTHGEYPSRLNDVTPALIEKLPHDIMSGEPLRYSRPSPDTFVLYSVGWDQSDNKGTHVPARKSLRTAGDWVWKPAPKISKDSASVN